MSPWKKNIALPLLVIVIDIFAAWPAVVFAVEETRSSQNPTLTNSDLKQIQQASSQPGEQLKSSNSSALSDSELAFLPTYLLAEKIRAGVVSSSRITGIYLNRIARYNQQINAIVTLDKEAARQRAKQADESLSRGVVWGPLHGVPITIKDNYAVEGMRSTAGYPPLKDNIPNEDATIVKRLRNAGAIILGKTNMPQLGLDAQTFNPIFGVTNNPWDLTKTPGGSSGGCAAAVAAGLTSFSIGNDIGGSIRSPAHLNGVFGIKPTEGFVPETGMVSEGESYRGVRHLLTHGPIARSVEDLSLILSIIAGSDGIDSEVPRVIRKPHKQKLLSEIKIAWTDNLSDLFVNTDSKDAIQGFVSRLVSMEIETSKAVPDDIDFAATVDLYIQLSNAEMLSDLSWLDHKLVCLFGGGCPVTDTKTYFKILSERDQLAEKIEAFLNEFDVWILPVESGPAQKHVTPDDYFGPFPVYKEPFLVDGEVDRSTDYLSIFNLTGHPSVVIPVGFSKEGLPIGVQIIGRKWYDAELLAVAEQLASVAAEYKHPPNYE